MAEHIIGDLITAEGRTVKFGKATDKACPNCGHGETPNMMHIRVIIDNTATIECPSCGYSEHVPKELVEEIRDMKGRLVKPPKM
jgi:DNA-directed RNA polymerase subunit M/transcription elongation factor TFIIS